MFRLFKTVFIFLLLLAPVRLCAQNYVQSVWLGYAEDSYTRIMQIDKGGNAYIIMASRYDINFCGKPFERHAASDYSVIGKLNSAGKVMWSRTISPVNGSDQIYDLQVDDAQNVYLSGAGYNIKLDDGETLPGGTFLVKLDKAGKTQWGVGAETYNGSAQIGGPIALSNDGVFWSSIFYTKINLQGYELNANVPNGWYPEGFVAKVNAAGKITAIYHDPSVSSIPQILVSSGGESATAVMSRGGSPKFQVTLDANCKVVAEKPFILYGDFPAPVRPIDNGYEMITSVFNPTPNGPEALGYFDIKMDKYLNVLNSVKVFPDAATRRDVYSAINYNNNGYFCIAPASNYWSVYSLDWLYTDGKGAVTILPNENKTDYLPDAFTRDLVKVEGETLNMMVRHYGVYEQNFTFDGKDYTTPSNLHFSYFWVKYLHEDPDPCKRISATVTQNGLEGSKNVSIKYSLLKDCPAEDDIVIHLTDLDPQLNQGDFTLPATITISKGQTSATLIIPVTNDNLMEEQESFTVKAVIPDNPLGYTISGAAAGTLFYIDDDDNTEDNRKFKVTYTPLVTEGSSGKIKVALLGTALLSQPLSFMLAETPPAFAATAGFDYTPFALTIPAGQREIEIDLDALTDQLIEGDEFIKGDITTGGNTLGQFTSTENTVAITILDADNTVANRVIEITPATDVLNEGNSITYSFQLPTGIGVQYALDINAQLLKWFTYLQATGITGLQISYTNKKPQFTITYPDDNIISIDDVATMLLSAVDSHAGAYRFKWKGVITNELVINPVDNDKNFYLELSPSYQTVNEGQSGNITVQLSGGLTLTDDIAINYQWGGTDVAADGRVQVKQGNIVLRKGQRSVALPFDILDDDLVNVYNERNINFTAASSLFGPVTFQPSATAAVDILNNDYLELTIPNTFTPNGDGVNDKWLITGLDSDPKSKMSVFNRYGVVVFSSVGYAKPWDGTANGKELPVGVYYYTIYFDGKKYSGNITLLR